MSPTRRDVLASMGIASLALALPAASTGKQTRITPTEPIHAIGHSAFEVCRGGQALVSSEVEFYADANKAIAWISRPDGTPQRLVFREPQAVATATLLMRHILGEACTRPSVVCPECDGAGWHAPPGEDEQDCRSCDGRGYVV